MLPVKNYMDLLIANHKAFGDQGIINTFEQFDRQHKTTAYCRSCLHSLQAVAGII